MWGDSSCVDNKEDDMSCMWVVEAMLDYTQHRQRSYSRPI